jgi:hypothetical protein
MCIILKETSKECLKVWTEEKEHIPSLRLIMLIGLVLFGFFISDTLDPFTGFVDPKFIVSSIFICLFAYLILRLAPILRIIFFQLYYKGSPAFLPALYTLLNGQRSI